MYCALILAAFAGMFAGPVPAAGGTAATSSAELAQ